MRFLLWDTLQWKFSDALGKKGKTEATKSEKKTVVGTMETLCNR